MTAARRYAPFAALAVCMACLYPVQKWIDASPPLTRTDDEALYLSNGESVRRLALGYEALLSDLYWLRAIQYFGGKIYDDPSVLESRSERMKLLYPLLDVTTTLDPNYVPAYRFGGLFIHDYVDPTKAFALLEKGIHNNPNDWQLYHDLGFLYWTDGRCAEAARTYQRASQLATAPAWLTTMGPIVAAECGDISLAEKMYTHLLEEADDDRVRDDARARLLGLQARKEIDLLAGAIETYRARAGENPPSLPHLLSGVTLPAGPDVPRIRVDRAGAPVDPAGVPYVYDPTTGKITTDPHSVKLPTKVFSRKNQ